MTQLQEIEQIIIKEIVEFDDSDVTPDTRTHFINPPMNKHLRRPGMTAKDIVDVARTLGVEIVALCGYRFIPKANPENLDTCEACMKIAQDIISEDG